MEHTQNLGMPGLHSGTALCPSSVHSLASTQGQRSRNSSRAVAELKTSLELWAEDFPGGLSLSSPAFGQQPFLSLPAAFLESLAGEARHGLLGGGKY